MASGETTRKIIIAKRKVIFLFQRLTKVKLIVVALKVANLFLVAKSSFLAIIEVIKPVRVFL